MAEQRSNPVKRFGVRYVKPVVSDATWRVLRDPFQRRVPEARSPFDALTLTEVARQFGTDKWGVHRYTPHYERHLQHLKEEPFTLLEIGIGGYARTQQGGASLRMWKHYFGKADVVGLDIQDKSFVDEERITTYQGSQTDADVLKRIIADHGRPKVVIDDGSHRPEHIRETFAILFPELADDGVYVIEDTQTSYWPRWGGAMDLDDPTTTMALVKDLLDGLNWPEWRAEGEKPSYTDEHVVSVHAYHNLVFLEKGRNREGTTRKAIDRPAEQA